MTRRLKFIAILALALSAAWAMRPKPRNVDADARTPVSSINVHDFLAANCFACHDSRTKKGNLDLTSLKFDPADAKAFAVWVKVHDRVRDGEMPPKAMEQPDAATRAAFLKALAEPLVKADEARVRREGRATWRRMNRYEYENTLRDLLGTPRLQIKEMLPEDGEAYRFNKTGEALGVNVQKGQRSLSWTSGGVLIPSEEKPSEIFKRLFLVGSPEEIEAQMRRLALGQSVMDTVADQTRQLQRNLGGRDRERLDQYFTGVRDLEQRLGQAAEWEQKPKPVVSEKPPVDVADARDYIEKVRLLYDLARLAFETDSTRLIALLLDSVNSPAVKFEGETMTAMSDSYHGISHHGKSPDKLRQFELADRAHMRLLDQLFTDLKSRKEGGETLFDRTMTLYGTNLGDANAHVTTNLPTLFAGGGFKHGQHLAFDRERNYPLTNLFVNVLQRLGIEADKFASSTGTMRGLEMI